VSVADPVGVTYTFGKLEQAIEELVGAGEVQQMAASYPENHSTRLAIESLELYRARTVVEGDIVTLRGSLGYGTL
jgi:hypothetical protein